MMFKQHLCHCQTTARKREAPGSARGSRASLRSESAANLCDQGTLEKKAIPSHAKHASRVRSQVSALRQMCVFALCFLTLRTAAHAQDVQPLPPNTLIERELTSTQAHTYRITLKAGQFVHFDVFQKSIDVVMSLIAPDGKQIAEVDLPGFGMPESLSEIATTSGEYQLTIRSFGVSKLKGQYELKAEVKDAATDADKKRMTAERLGWEFSKLSNPQKRLENVQQARQLWAELGERFWEGYTLSRMSGVYNTLNDYTKAMTLMEEAIRIMREVKSRAAEAIALRNLGNMKAARLTKAELPEEYERALLITREIGDKQLEVRLLLEIADRQSSYPRWNELAQQALQTSQEIGDKTSEATAQRQLGTLNMVLGNYEKAAERYEQYLKLSIEAKNKGLQVGAYNHLGTIYRILGRHDQAMEALRNGLQITRELKMPSAEGAVLVTMSKLEYDRGNYEQALEMAQQSLNIQSNRPNTSDVFPFIDVERDLGNAYRGLKQYDKAIQYHTKAYITARSSPHVYYQRLLLAELMHDWKGMGWPDTAIFYGKQIINVYQEVRADIRNFDRQTQQNYVSKKESDYRTLADLLISQARLPEAEQVLRMLKEEEYFEYIRGSANDVPKGEKATLTPKEEAADKRYREVADKLAALGAERSALLNKPSRTEAENQRLKQIESDLAVAGQAFQKFLDKLNDELKTTKDAGKVSQLRDAQGLMEDLRELGQGAVALYTVVGEDTFSIVLTTADVQKAYQVPIKAAELNRKVLAFRQALQNPTLDPLPLAQELYKTLLGPVEKDLRAAKAELLMWSLDGVLRYVPMAALHDGKQYLVESYRHAVFTPASNARLHLEPSKHWRALGLGVTKAHGEGVPALPGVAEEMRGIIKAEGSSSGVLPGTIKLDEQFTQESMLTGLRERNNVVHIASHFQFQPGNETNSALLLGDGQLLSLAQIKALPNVFSGVELLTLSACNTATSGSGANGKEVEGFGVLAQRQGARAVVASLWPVADHSTTRLMQEFYQLRETGLSKAEAMREAQRKMLRGALSVATISLTRSIVHETETAAGMPKFKADPQSPFAHPYYWAPFILIGNWK
ncbi:MAG: CHAT domain-containing protein [Acidobacteria bacterium]|nr:CHAT domain-containing protein [Acidobacteriota bacterium]